MHLLSRLLPPARHGLARRIYAAFLVAAVLPTAFAGAIGVKFSLDALKEETLRSLDQEVTTRSQELRRFFGQLSSELMFLAASPTLAELRIALDNKAPKQAVRVRQSLERNYVALAKLYPHIYQIRYIDRSGMERVRVDYRGEQVVVVPQSELQNKADRYYFQEAIAGRVGDIYASPLDLNVEYGKVEIPEKPVIRIATPVGDAGKVDGLLIVNLHANLVLDIMQQMADARSGTVYLFDRSGHYLARRAGQATSGLSMLPTEALASQFGQPVLDRLFASARDTQFAAGEILAHATVALTSTAQAASRPEWVLAVSYPEQAIFDRVFNLKVLYVVLFTALLVTALGGYALTRRLLGPVEALAKETEAIAAGDFSQRVQIDGQDEIARLGEKFNAMAGRLEASYRSLANHRDRLEEEVRERTRELEQQQERQRETDRQMFQMEKMTTLGELAMGVAHEIGNPLAGMKAVAQSLQYEDNLAPPVQAALARLESEIDRLSDFLQSFHGFAAPQPMKFAACSLAEVLDDVLFWTRKEARQHGVEIITDVDDVPPLWADAPQLKQVLLNLVVNALHAMPNGGVLKIAASVDAATACIGVADNGCGMTAEVLPHIFDPFFTTRADGSGIGLAVVAKITHAHGGEIEVESEPGHGSCFNLTWPLAKEKCW